MSKITNTNTNIQQIIFPEGYELRKIKKKKKKGLGNRRKKALNELKSVLAEYDSILSEAEEKKIEIPKELGELPVNVNDINTIKEIESLTADLRERINAINQLMSTKTRQQRAISLFDMPQRSGSYPLQPTVLPPTIIPASPQIPLQPQIPIRPSPIQPDRQSPTETKSDTEDQLEKIQKEIMGKLTPEQRTEAEKKMAELKEKAKMEKEGADKEAREKMEKEDNVPTSQKYRIDNFKYRSQIPTQSDQKILGEKFIEPIIGATRGRPDSGIGLYDKFRDVRNWMSKLKNKLRKDAEDSDQYLLEAGDAREAETQKRQLRVDYEYFIGQLNQEQAESINEISALKRMNQSIEQILSQPVQLTAQEEIEAEKGRKIQVFILDPAKSAEERPLTPKKKPQPISPPRSPSDSSDESFDAGDEPSRISIQPMPRSDAEFKNFNDLMSSYVMNVGKNWSKNVSQKVKNLLISIKKGEDYLKSENENYRPKFTGDVDTEIAKLDSLKGVNAVRQRREKVDQYIRLFNIVKGDNPIEIKVLRPVTIPKMSPVRVSPSRPKSEPSLMFM